MVGFFFGAACLLGFAVVAAGGRRSACGPRGPYAGRAAWHHHHHAWDHDQPRRRGKPADVAAKAAGEVFKRRLGVDDEQEPIVDHALADLRASLAEATGSVKDAREALAAALKGAEVDDAAVAVAFARWDETLTRTRREALSAVKQIHAVLDDEQRAQAADWLAAGGPSWGVS